MNRLILLIVSFSLVLSTGVIAKSKDSYNGVEVAKIEEVANKKISGDSSIDYFYVFGYAKNGTSYLAEYSKATFEVMNPINDALNALRTKYSSTWNISGGTLKATLTIGDKSIKYVEFTATRKTSTSTTAARDMTEAQYLADNGWHTDKEGIKTYYKNKVLQTNTFITDNGNTYYVASAGVPVTGWKKIDKLWYYFDTNGIMQKNRWVDTYYYLNAYGAMYTNYSLTIDGKSYTFDSEGKATLNSTTTTTTNQPSAKTTDYDSKTTTTYTNNTPVGPYRVGWLTYQGQKYYCINSTTLASSWLEINNKWYYFNTLNYILETNCWISNKYYVNNSGEMLTNTWTPDGYYVDENGAWVASKGKKSNTSTTNNSNITSNNKSNTNSSTNTDYNQRTIIASNIENPYKSSNVNYLTEEQEQAIINGANSITEIINGNSNSNSNINNNSNIINTTNNTVSNNTTNSNENLKNNTISSSNNSNSYLSELDDLLDNNKVDTSIIYKAKSTISNGSSFYLSTVENGSLEGWEKYVINTKVTSGNNQGVWFKYNTTWYFIISAENKAEDSNGKKLTINNNTAYVIEDILKDGIYVISSDSKYMAYKFDEDGKCLTPNGLTNSSGTAILFKTNGEIKSGYAKEVSEDESTLKIYDTTASKSVKIDGVSRTVTFIDDTYEKNGSNYSGTYLNDGYWIKSTSSKYTLMKSDSNGKTSSVSAAGSTLGEIETYITKKNYTNQASEVVLSNSKTTTTNTSSSNYGTITTYTYTTKDLLTISSSAINSGSLELNINNKTLLGQGTYYNTIDNKTYTVNSSGNISNVSNGKTSGATSGSYSKLVIDSTNYLIK